MSKGDGRCPYCGGCRVIRVYGPLSDLYKSCAHGIRRLEGSPEVWEFPCRRCDDE